MNEKFDYGEAVIANIDGDGPVLGFVTGGPHNEGDAQKFSVTGLDGREHSMAYTEGAGKSPPSGYFTRG